MDFAERVAERRIREAIERGELDGLSGSGKPLRLEDDSHVPEDLRLAYKVLKNSGCIPQELELKKEINALAELLSTLDDDAQRLRRLRELNFKLLKFNTLMKRPLSVAEDPCCEQLLAQRLLGKDRPGG